MDIPRDGKRGGRERYGGGKKDNTQVLTWVELKLEEIRTVVTSMLLLFTSSLAFREQKERKQSQTFHFRHNRFSEMADSSVLWETTIILNLIEQTEKTTSFSWLKLESRGRNKKQLLSNLFFSIGS